MMSSYRLVMTRNINASTGGNANHDNLKADLQYVHSWIRRCSWFLTRSGALVIMGSNRFHEYLRVEQHHGFPKLVRCAGRVWH